MKIINLLPKLKQREIRYERVIYGLVVFAVLTIASFVVVVGLQFLTKIYLKSETVSVETEISNLRQQVNKQDNEKIKNQVKAINDVVDDYQSLAAGSPEWSKVIIAFSKLPPQGVKVNSFAAEKTTKKVVISGSSPTRELVIQLYNNILKDSQEFYNVDYPLENVVKPTNINFHFTFFIKDKLLP